MAPQFVGRTRGFAVHLRCLGFALALAGSASAWAADDTAARVVIVANADDPDSTALASFYADHRGIPRANIVTLPLPSTETITWDVFAEDLYHPLQHWLVEHGWADGTTGPTPAEIDLSTHRLSYLVLCRGVPLRIEHDPARITPEYAAAHPPASPTNEASVDTELALLAARHDLVKINGPAANPFFEQAHPPADVLRTFVRVTRLDGPDRAACEHLILSALAGEQRGLAGRAYIDEGGPHPMADRWFERAAAALRARDFDVTVNGPGGMFAETDRFDAPIIYLGWYAADLNGPMQIPGFQFPAGAIALHIHSFSAETLHSDTQAWCGPLVARGVAATVGNVFEPNLEFTHRPDLLVAALLDGAAWGEAAYYALPVLSWQSVVIGDPLYRPFAHGLADQVAALPQRHDAGVAYVALREAHHLARTGGPDAELAWLVRESSRHPGLALNLRLARREFAAGDTAAARGTLALFRDGRAVRPDEFGVVAEAAALLMAQGTSDDAVVIYRGLLEQPLLTDAWRRVLLPRARDAASAAGDDTLTQLWSEELEKLQ